MATPHGNLLHVTVASCNRLKDTEWISRQDPYVCVEYGSARSRTRTCTEFDVQKPASSNAQPYGAPQASLYSAPLPHSSVSYPSPTSGAPYAPAGGYASAPPYPLYPPNLGANPWSPYPPQGAYYAQPYPPNPVYPPQPYGSQYPPGPPYPGTYPPLY
ncbi:hypothetical protein SSX86_021053 [Deinandra increscens subsp. villosa]|uniref:Uncharacterized protein n=1 Tax=Deinandra increscens subsp. villosa TaxID=3103831 RepID=A0AAP0CP58_9ASTR